MEPSQALSLNQFAALLLPRRRAPDVLTLAADLALKKPLRVVDGGNLFNVLILSRMVRQRTVNVVEVLNRIYISRAFTCYQMEAMLADLEVNRGALLVLDLLGTFYDENVDDAQSRRLLGRCIAHLKRYSANLPVLVSVFPPGAAGKRKFLMDMLLQEIDHVWQWESPEKPPQQLALGFSEPEQRSSAK